MKITIHQPLTFREQGQRAYNEDFVYPNPLTKDTRFFLVCDGMGGLDKGEEASKIVAQTVFDYLPLQRPIGEEDIVEVVKVAHLHLQQYLDSHISLTRMGTTLTLLCLQNNSALVTHIGDSRVYHIRNGEILYKTRDHKQVLDMVEADIITAEQAINHPWRNRLSRSVSVRRDSGGHTDKPHIQHITDLQAGDYFFMCSDGVLEQVTDDILCQILASEQSNEEKKAAILEICEGKTKDNYSAILVQLAAIKNDGIGVTPIKTFEDEPVSPPLSQFNTEPMTPVYASRKHTPKQTTSWFTWLGIALVFVGCALAAYMFWPQKNEKPPQLPKPSNGKPVRPDSNVRKRPSTYHNLKPLAQGLQLAQNQAGKYGVLTTQWAIVIPFEYDHICLCRYQTHLRLTDGHHVQFVALKKLVTSKSFSLFA